MTTSVVTLFSGGLDSAYTLLRLGELGFRDVTALLVDVGAPYDEPLLKETAARLGAQLRIIDARETFAEEFVAPAIAAHATYLNTHPVSSSLSRPLLAREAVRIAGEIGARVVLHTANQSQNSLRRLNGAIAALGYDGFFGTPYELDADSRLKKQAALEHAGLSFYVQRETSGDENLWCREFESGVLDDPEDVRVPAEMFEWSRLAGEPADETLVLAFREGRPVAVDGEVLPLVELIMRLNERVGRYGLGRYTSLEHIDTGEKVVEVREMPAAHLLLDAYRRLESATVSSETIRTKLVVEQAWVREAVEGRWFGQLREACQRFVFEVRAHVTGEIRYHLGRHGADVTSVRAARPLYIRDRDAWETVACGRGTRSFTTLG
ncbi:argininosuccinate synthase [Actinoplanes sp. TBRC 11911]|nr:argininosuccinate synthase [Actinoplanes sp. TBRC 11911]